MPASLARKARRAALNRVPFVTDGHERLVEGVRYTLVAPPPANCSNVKRGSITQADIIGKFVSPNSLLANAFNAAEERRQALIAEGWRPRTRAPKPLPPQTLCDTCHVSIANHYTYRGNYCRSCGIPSAAYRKRA